MEQSETKTAQHFVDDLFADIELAFVAQFGKRWTPAISQLYEAALGSCLARARAVDDGVAKPSAPRTQGVVLTNYKLGR